MTMLINIRKQHIFNYLSKKIFNKLLSFFVACYSLYAENAVILQLTDQPTNFFLWPIWYMAW